MNIWNADVSEVFILQANLALAWVFAGLMAYRYERRLKTIEQAFDAYLRHVEVSIVVRSDGYSSLRSVAGEKSGFNRYLMLLPLVFMSGCYAQPTYDGAGKVIYRPTSVAAEYRAEYESLEREVNSYARYELLKVSAQGEGSIACDEEAVLTMQHEWFSNPTGGRVLGYATLKNVYLGDHANLAGLMRKAVLAHEIGHAMGLAHTNSGLMAAAFDETVVGHEAFALLQALNEQGVAVK